MANEKCKICGGSGLIPFKNKQGMIVPYAWIYCECHDEYANPYPYQLKPSDIDYSVSYSHYRSLCREHGWQDPGPDYPKEPPKPQEQVVIHRNSDMGKEEYDLLRQTALRAIHLEKQLNEHMKPKKKPETYGYRGIR